VSAARRRRASRQDGDLPQERQVVERPPDGERRAGERILGYAHGQLRPVLQPSIQPAQEGAPRVSTTPSRRSRRGDERAGQRASLFVIVNLPARVMSFGSRTVSSDNCHAM